MGFLSKAWDAVRSFQFARYLKPLWKKLLGAAITSGGDSLQKAAKEKFLAEGPGKLNELVDKWQADVKEKLKKLPLPSGIEDKVVLWIDQEVDSLQEKLGPAAISGGAEGIDKVFDESQRALLKGVESL